MRGRLPNGLEVSERRIPIGVVGANFEARPNVAVDVAGQLLKSLNGAVLRTGGAALRTVTALVDEVLRPGARRGGAAARGRRARPLGRPGGRARARLAAAARAARDPARQRRDDGGAGAARGRAGRPDARARGRRRRALCRGVGRSGQGRGDRRGEPRPAWRLQPAQSPARRRGAAAALLERVARDARPARDRAARHGAGAGARRDGAARVRLGHEWANDAERVATVTVDVVDGPEEAVAIANGETSALAATIVAEDAASRTPFSPVTAAQRRSGRRRRGSPTASPSPARRRPGSTSTGCRGRAGLSPTGTSGCASTESSATARSAGEPAGRRQARLGARGRRARPGAARAAACARRRDRGARRRPGRRSASSRPGRSRSGCRSLGLAARPRSLPRLQAASALGQSRLQRAWEEAFARAGLRAAQVLLTGAEIADRRAYVNVRGALERPLRRSARAGRERERRDGDRRDQLRRQRRPRGAGRRALRCAAARAPDLRRGRLHARTRPRRGEADQRGSGGARGRRSAQGRARPRRDGEQDSGR